ncbi:MAG: radical SAM protein [Acidilobaceae archaeon]
MIPLTTMILGKGTVSFRIKGSFGKSRPSTFSTLFRPVVFWNITYKCNLYCIHCYISASPQGLPDELTTAEALRVVDMLAEVNVPLVILSGGEPLVRGDFWDILGRLRDYGLRVSLSTNGTLISRSVAEKLAKLEVSYVGVSLDSVYPEFHDKFRGVPGAFRRALDGVKSAREVGLSVGFRMTITRFNISEAPKLVDLARNMGVERISYYLIDLTGRARDNIELLPEKIQLEELINKLVEKTIELDGDPEILIVRGNFVGIYLADKLAKSREEFKSYLSMIEAQGDCGRKTISIYPNGKVKPCQFLDYDIGDIRDSSLKEILKLSNEKLKPFLEVYKYLEGPRCSRCPFKEICGGGSRGRSLAVTGNFWGDDPLCIVDIDKIRVRWLGS